jgi:hypothetical protein
MQPSSTNWLKISPSSAETQTGRLAEAVAAPSACHLPRRGLKASRTAKSEAHEEIDLNFSMDEVA